MKRTLLVALSWAAAILGVAFAGNADLIPQSSADKMVIVMPVLAVLSIGLVSRKSSCGVRA